MRLLSPTSIKTAITNTNKIKIFFSFFTRSRLRQSLLLAAGCPVQRSAGHGFAHTDVSSCNSVSWISLQFAMNKSSIPGLNYLGLMPNYIFGVNPSKKLTGCIPLGELLNFGDWNGLFKGMRAGWCLHATV